MYNAKIADFSGVLTKKVNTFYPIMKMKDYR